MKKSTVLLSLLFLLFSDLPVSAQSKILGDWEGVLVAGSQRIKLIFHIRQDGTNFKGTFDSPNQSAVNLPISSVEIAGDSLKIHDNGTGVTIAGLYLAGKDSINSLFMQRGAQLNLMLGRSAITGYSLNRPQTPKPPFPYKSEEVVFVNKKARDIKLAGTLTIPNNVQNPPAVILISGSGPEDRNEKVFNHEPFLILSDYLSRHGIAVLRYDDRGVAKSEGDFNSATTYDFSTDAEAALEFLRTRNDIDINKIGLIGHSEGGMIAPMVVARNSSAAFIVLLAGPGVSIDKLMVKQTEDEAKAANMSDGEIENALKVNKAVYAVIRETEEAALAEKSIRDILSQNNFALGNKDACDSFVRSMLSPWFSYFIRFTPEEYLQKVKCPVLALNGDLDKQVDAAMNLEAIREALKKGKNSDFDIQYLHGLNHLFQEAKTGNESEYMLIEQTMSPLALEAIEKWIHGKF